MKTTFLKAIVPVATFMLAIGGAFGSKDSAADDFAAETGWINSPTACSVSKQCDTQLNDECTIMVNHVPVQAFGKTSESPLACTKILYERP